jgi:Leucine-rich repeat (LRR) protein
MKELWLSHNSLATIPDWLVELRELRLLAMDGNSISALPSLETCPHLEHLSISDNPLVRFPPLPVSLKSVWATRTAITEFPGPLLLLSNLQELVLSHCHISDIPPEISSIASLQKLFLNGNQLQTIPGSISLLPDLVELDLRDNPLKSLPDAFVDIQVNQLSMDSIPFPISDSVRSFLDTFDPSGWRE